MAVTYDEPSSTAKVYIDGQLVSTCSKFGFNPSNIHGVATDLFIGRSLEEVDPFLSGELGCFRIYNRALRCVRGRLGVFAYARLRYWGACMLMFTFHSTIIPQSQQRVRGGGRPLRWASEGAYSKPHYLSDQGAPSSHYHPHVASDGGSPVQGAPDLVSVRIAIAAAGAQAEVVTPYPE